MLTEETEIDVLFSVQFYENIVCYVCSHRWMHITMGHIHLHSPGPTSTSPSPDIPMLSSNFLDMPLLASWLLHEARNV
jgi:hypothetical protein